MSDLSAKQQWEEYKKQELELLDPVLHDLGYTLDEVQPHLGGERYLAQAVTTESGPKIIVLAQHAENGTRVVIKATGDPAGMREIAHERRCRQVLRKIGFAYRTFHAPQELLYTRANGLLVAVQEFIAQDKPFLERPAEEQFALALKAFKAQEGAHATTYRHFLLARKTFGIMRSADYLETFARFDANLQAQALLQQHANTIEQYCGFLTHTDFVPHNFRVVGQDIYLLDNASLRFGNKYEGWARFINFMTLYHPQLARWLVRYIADNRSPEEVLALRLMRIYRLGEIVHYYRETLPRAEGDLYTLNTRRVEFWSAVLSALLEDTEVPQETVESYKKMRDALRSPEEKERQKGLH